MSRFVRTSKFRHVFGTGTPRQSTYDNIKVSRSAWDTDIAAVNSLFLSVATEAGGGGQFVVVPLEKVGKMAPDYPVFLGHTSAVIDTDFNPFNDHIVASAGEDGKVLVWKIPEGGPTTNQDTPIVSLTTHSRKCGHVKFHPTADNVLLSTGADLLVKLYDIEKGVEKQNIAVHPDIINSVTFNYDGSLLATVCKDKKIRIIDIRSGKVEQCGNSHEGTKGARVIWLGDSNRLVTTGFSKTSDRQICLWDSQNLETAIKTEVLDTSSGQLMPYYDQDTSMLWLAGKGDGMIRYFDVDETAPYIHALSEYRTSEPHRGIAWAPKRSLDIMNCEVARAYKVTVGGVEPISFKVPRKADHFQSDLFPPTRSSEPSLTADEYFAGKTVRPKTVSLENGAIASEKKDFVSKAETTTEEKRDPLKSPQNEKEYMAAFHALRKENEELKNQLNTLEVKLRQAELQK